MNIEKVLKFVIDLLYFVLVVYVVLPKYPWTPSRLQYCPKMFSPLAISKYSVSECLFSEITVVTDLGFKL